MNPFDPIKDPADDLDYTVDFTRWLQAGETITGVTWAVPTGLAKGATSYTDTTATIWIAPGGTPDTDYEITCTVTTNQGRIKVAAMPISIRKQ